MIPDNLRYEMSFTALVRISGHKPQYTNMGLAHHSVDINDSTPIWVLAHHSVDINHSTPIWV